ncbi:SemiSWEET family sugar transporter [Niabella drilacis]|uniref:Sugar efflux transporter for intercellular exchange n=1 Tax=Niabella drilacis (strain DSM 25811 / CCM 8410 / CCUG 62505 / LMG 26954 / E90) TaxID=1285928 RepID=A0A1G7BW15_NIADE|nr:SemiSWEET family transporter [Niabella drilacis]SDE31291.1 Sugar efflux transporter for intercellular exchange [Niabella drilacis]
MKIDIVSIIGSLTVACSFALKFVGFPSQIKKIQKTKSTAGLSVTLFGISFFSYVLWTVYGILKRDWVTILGQGVGILASGAVLYLIWKDTIKNKL